MLGRDIIVESVFEELRRIYEYQRVRNGHDP